MRCETLFFIFVDMLFRTWVECICVKLKWQGLERRKPTYIRSQNSHCMLGQKPSRKVRGTFCWLHNNILWWSIDQRKDIKPFPNQYCEIEIVKAPGLFLKLIKSSPAKSSYQTRRVVVKEVTRKSFSNKPSLHQSGLNGKVGHFGQKPLYRHCSSPTSVIPTVELGVDSILLMNVTIVTSHVYSQEKHVLLLVKLADK